MKTESRIAVLAGLGLFVFSCSFLDKVTDLILNQTHRFTDSPTPVVIIQAPPEEVITPDADLSSDTNTPTTQVAAPPTETPKPTALKPDGPYILYGGKNGVWISNPDGSFLTQIFADAFHNGFRSAVSPDGSHLALVRRDDAGFELILLDLPGGQQTFVVRLLDGFGEDYEEPIEDPRIFVEQVFSNYSSIAWQPGRGDLLAFVGAVNGETTDLYVYDTRTQEIIQLSDEPSFAVLPRWSPDGEYLLYYGVGWESPIGGALVQHNRLYGAWMVNPQEGQIMPMPIAQTTRIGFVDWLDDQHYLSCDDFVLNSVDVATGQQTALMDCPAHTNEISQSPTNGALLLSFRSDYSEDFDEGLFYLASPFDTPRKVHEIPAWELAWLPESNVFFAYPEVLVTGDGLLSFFPPRYNHSYLPAVSTNGIQAWKVYDEDRQPEVKVYVPGDDDWQTILRESVEGLIWDPLDPGRLLLLLRDGRLMTAQFPNFVPEVRGNFGGSVSEAIYVP